MESPKRVLEAPESTQIHNQGLGESFLSFFRGGGQMWETYTCRTNVLYTELLVNLIKVPVLSGRVLICSWVWLTLVVSVPASVPWVNLYSCHITRQNTFISFSQTCSVDKAFFYGADVQASWHFFFFVASHDPWQTQLPPWWWCVPAAYSMEQPCLANWYICLQSQDQALVIW